MYDTEGRLLDRLETGVQKVSEYNIDFVNMLQRADGLVLWLNLSKTFQEDEDGTVHQRVEGTKCFVVQEKAIAQIAIDGSAGIGVQYRGHGFNAAVKITPHPVR